MADSIVFLDDYDISGYMIGVAYLILDRTYVCVRILWVVSSIMFQRGLILLIFFFSCFIWALITLTCSEYHYDSCCPASPESDYPFRGCYWASPPCNLARVNLGCWKISPRIFTCLNTLIPLRYCPGLLRFPLKFLGYIISSCAFFADSGKLIRLDTCSYVLMVLHASVLLLVITVMSSAQVETTGLSFWSDPQFSMALVSSSATNRNR